MTKFIHKIKCICLDILSTWAYIRRCTELPEFFFFTLFLSFLIPPYDVQSWGVPEHMFKHDKKVMNCAQLGCHSFRSYSYLPRYAIMRNEVFVYLEIYWVYREESLFFWNFLRKWNLRKCISKKMDALS